MELESLRTSSTGRIGWTEVVDGLGERACWAMVQRSVDKGLEVPDCCESVEIMRVLEGVEEEGCAAVGGVGIGTGKVGGKEAGTGLGIGGTVVGRLLGL